MRICNSVPWSDDLKGELWHRYGYDGYADGPDDVADLFLRTGRRVAFTIERRQGAFHDKYMM